MKKTAIILLALALAALMLAGCTGGGDDLSDAVAFSYTQLGM